MTAVLQHRRWRQMRARWATRLPVTCPRCGQPIYPWQAWDLGHHVDRADRPDLALLETNARPEHATCNRRAGAARTNTRRHTFGW